MNDDIELDPVSGPEWRQVINRAASTDSVAPADDIEETATDRLARMLATIGSGGRATVKLYRNRSGKREWCADYSPTAFEQGGLNLIREEWGPGEYEVVLYGERQLESGKGHYGVRARESIDIAAPRSAAGAAPAVSTPAMNGELVRMIDALAQGQARMVELLAQRPAAPDPNAQMMQMMQMMKLAREAFAPDAAPKSQVSEIVAAMRELRQAGEELNPKAEPSDPLTAALPGMINLIGQSMQRQQTPPAQGFDPVSLPASMAAPQTEQLPEAQPKVEQPEPDQAMAIATLKMHLAMLIDLASKGAPIEEAATIVYDRAPDEIIDLLGFPNWFSMLEQFEPKVKPYAQWFASVAARVSEMLAAESD